MASYKLLVKRSAVKEIENIGLKRDRSRIVAAIGALADNPRAHGVEKLAGEENRYRVRVGDYRVLYEIDDQALSVWIVKVAHRREVYR